VTVASKHTSITPQHALENVIHFPFSLCAQGVFIFLNILLFRQLVKLHAALPALAFLDIPSIKNQNKEQGIFRRKQ